MSETFHWAQFAPSLAHLLPEILKREAVLNAFGSGPQPQARDYDPNEPEYLALIPDDPRGGVDFWVTLTANGCFWFDQDGRWECSHSEFFAYLDQLPRRLHTFGRCVE